MDFQVAFNLAAAVAGALMGAILKTLWDSNRETAKSLGALEKELSDRYAKRSEVEKLAEALFRKLDGMAETQLKILLSLETKADNNHLHGNNGSSAHG